MIKPKANRKSIEFDLAEYMDDEDSIAFFVAEAFETGDQELILATLNAVARARGMAELAEQAGMGRQSIYKALGPGGNPTLSNLLAIAKGLGVSLSAKAG